MIEYCDVEGRLLRIKCKNLQRFGVLFGSGLECSAHAESVNKARSHPPAERYAFAFAKAEGYRADGWGIFEPLKEYDRLGLPDAKWRLSTANRDFKMCPSYPKHLIVPADVDDATLAEMAEFRHLRRFPIVRYIHPKTRAPLLVASQPLSGTKDVRCYEDERMFRSILQAGPNPDKNGYIIDLRSKDDATGFKSKGGGSESIDHYFGWNPEGPDGKRRPVHADLGKEQALTDALAKFADACVSTDMSSFVARADASGWLHYIKTTLSTAVVVSRILVREALPVVIHASTGCDVELQVLSLAQLFMDQHFRTFEGFKQLIEKEWIDLGYPFESRSSSAEAGPARPNASKSARFMAPVFILFLDCVWQCLKQYPCAFEFNEAFLLALAEHSQASRFGTFLYDCQNEREAAGLADKTLSFWGFCDEPDEIRRFKNVFYEPLPGWIKPSFRPQSIQAWLALYGAGTPYLDFHDEVHELLMFLKDKRDTAKEEIELKQAELAELEKQMAAAGLE
eukprot:CAMPEP_0182918304 /NCGR_PEP_ID=MMETSP0105_2-20130417/2009_1 /TAXON_ID=81532 ORGANISM="Acanthoeca-like sp., Strain 10tr" /NCGR_SAMPLE_ID=MMETSP0105_2 /ASSEMBLY_ACC=CAM_ASM_000205 /LENGTH=508 /DNA_ID=CAMNT_0025055375 /DNA_START=113 /DNA_END=1639 /DNA_ORIENTATION=+